MFLIDVIMEGEDVDLDLLPIVHHAEFDSGKYITAGMTVCRNPDTGILNIGIYRQEVTEQKRVKCRISPRSNGDYIAKRYARLGKPMEVVVFIGHHPAVAMAAAAPIPLNKSEFELMAALLDEPLEVTRAATVDLPVPARAEIAIEGVIDPTEMVSDGPLGEASGYYGTELPCYVIQVTAITMRHDAIYHDLYPAHQEHVMVGILARQSSVYDRVKDAVPSVIAVNYGPEAEPGWGIMYLSIKKHSPGDGRLAGLTALQADPFVNIVTVVDEDIDVYDEKEVLWAVATRAKRNVEVVTDLFAPAHSGANWNSGEAKVLIDATMPVDKPFPKRVSPDRKLWDMMRLEDYLS